MTTDLKTLAAGVQDAARAADPTDYAMYITTETHDESIVLTVAADNDEEAARYHSSADAWAPIFRAVEATLGEGWSLVDSGHYGGNADYRSGEWARYERDAVEE